MNKQVLEWWVEYDPGNAARRALRRTGISRAAG